jgi:hypothetical protein
MLNIPQELENIHGLIHKAYCQCSGLKTVVLSGGEATPQFCGELDKLVSGLEHTVMRARYLGEASYRDIQPLEKAAMDYEKHWSGQSPPGKAEVDENGWLHITLDTLLPHCKKAPNPWLRDTLVRLLYGYRQSGKALPRFGKALLVIDEHCDVESRRVFDQDNKAWKVIPNVLKGLVIDDDDQHTLGVALVSTWDAEPACHIYVMDMADAGTFFSMFSGDLGWYFKR